jgi:hypothetical protein
MNRISAAAWAARTGVQHRHHVHETVSPFGNERVRISAISSVERICSMTYSAGPRTWRVTDEEAVAKGDSIEFTPIRVMRAERVLTQQALSEAVGLREAYLLGWRRAVADPPAFTPALFVAFAPALDVPATCADLRHRLSSTLGPSSLPDVIPFVEDDAHAGIVRQIGVRVYPSGLAHLARWRMILAIGISLAILALWEWLHAR